MSSTGATGVNDSCGQAPSCSPQPNGYHSAGVLLLINIDDEWGIGRCNFSQASTTALLEPGPMTEAEFLLMPVLPFTEEVHVS